jgi:Secretion system C-terminal sorting domain
VNTLKTSNIEVYPNPANNQIFIKGLNNGMQWKIYNAQGALICGGRESSVSIENLQSGIYFITVNDNTFKFVKM